MGPERSHARIGGRHGTTQMPFLGHVWWAMSPPLVKKGRQEMLGASIPANTPMDRLQWNTCLGTLASRGAYRAIRSLHLGRLFVLVENNFSDLPNMAMSPTQVYSRMGSEP